MATKTDKNTTAPKSSTPTTTSAPTKTTAAAPKSTTASTPAKPQDKDAKKPATSEPEGFSLVIIVKSVELLDNDEGGRISIGMQVGEHKITVEGTVAELNQRRSGNSVSIPSENPEAFKKFLTSNKLNIVIQNGKVKELAKATISLEKLATFEPPKFEATIVPFTVSLNQDHYVVGTIKLIVKTDRIRSVICLTAEEDSVLYVVNDAPERRSIEVQEETLRNLLVCGKCDALKSPSEISYQYELIDGILVNREYPRKDPDLDAIKRKIEQIEREALLYPMGKEQPAPLLKEPEQNRFCKVCGGESITGKTCDTEFPRHSSLIPEPNLGAPKPDDSKLQQPPESEQKVPPAHGQIDPKYSAYHRYPGPCQHDPNYLCPQSVGVRFCQRCGLNLDWLPLQSICPKCGHRPLTSPSVPPTPAQPAAAPPTSQGPLPTTRTHELTPSRLDSWMKDFEFIEPRPPRRRPSSGTLRSVSLDIRSCPMCRLRGGCCPDCLLKKTSAKAAAAPKPTSTTQSSTSDSEMMARRVSSERPKTRQSLRDRFRGFPKRLSKATRTSLLKNVYGEGKKEDGRRKSSNVSLNVEEILKQSDAEKRKFVTDGVQSVELRKVESKTGKVKDAGCPLHSAAGIKRNHRALKRRARRQNRGRFSYAYGNRHPGIEVGHCECDVRQGPVPPHMGWKWDIQTLGIGQIRKGWRPGAIRKPIKELMQHFLVSYPLDNVPVSRRRAGKQYSTEDQSTGPARQKPTLQIVKRNGEYIIEMNPLKDSDTLKTTQNPYLPCEPIRFKLAKDPKTAKLHQLRNALKVRFNLCECKDLDSCKHRHEKEKKIFQKELRKLSKRLGLPKATSVKDIPSESESELDLEFTPPSAMLESGVRKPDVVCTETQYCEEDYKVKVPADKVKCKSGREDPRNDAKASRTKLDKDGAKGGKGGKAGKGKGSQGDSKAVGSKAGGKGTGKGKGAETGGGDSSKTRVGGKGAAKTGSKMGVGAGSKTKISDGAKNKSGNAQQKSGNLAGKLRNPPVDKRAFVSKGCDLPPVTTCYQTPCAPVACYNPCYSMCPY